MQVSSWEVLQSGGQSLKSPKPGTIFRLYNIERAVLKGLFLKDKVMRKLYGISGSRALWSIRAIEENVAALMLLLNMVDYNYSAHTHFKRWADSCYARPSLAAAQARD